MTQRLITCELLLLSKPRITGIERYAFETIKSAEGPYRLVWGRPTEYTAKLRKESVARGWPVHEIDAPYYLAEQFLFGSRASDFNPKGIHYFSVAPGLLRPKAPFTITIHDVGAWRYPEFMSRGMKYVYRPIIERVIKSSMLRGVLTVSQFSKDEINNVLGVELDKILVVYPPRPRIFSVARRGKSQPFFLHVGTIEPRKDVGLILDAFRDAALEGVKLYLVGRMGWASLPKLPDNVHYLGPVDDNTLGDLYGNAIAVISASQYEGFGLPPAEALVAGGVAFLRDIPTYRELYGKHPNAWFFEGKEDLVDLIKMSPSGTDAQFTMPQSESFDSWMQKCF